MNRVTLFLAAAVAVLALTVPVCAAPSMMESPAAASPQAVAGHLTVYFHGEKKFDQDISEGKTKLFGELGFDLYLVLSSGKVTLEVDGPFGFSESWTVSDGPKHVKDVIDVPELGKVTLVLDLKGA